MADANASHWRIVAVNAMVVMTMALLLVNSDPDRDLAWWLWPVLFAPPMLALLSALFVKQRSAQRACFIVSAVLMLPAVAIGVFAGWGLLYAIAIAFLVVGSHD